MQTVSIEISNNQDLQLLLLLVQRLGLKLKKIEQNEPNGGVQKDLSYHLKVIENGGAMPQKRMDEMLKWHEEDRNDRTQPYRQL